MKFFPYVLKILFSFEFQSRKFRWARRLCSTQLCLESENTYHVVHFSCSLQYMNKFDALMNELDERFGILNSRKQYTSCANEGDKVRHTIPFLALIPPLGHRRESRSSSLRVKIEKSRLSHNYLRRADNRIREGWPGVRLQLPSQQVLRRVSRSLARPAPLTILPPVFVSLNQESKIWICQTFLFFPKNWIVLLECRIVCLPLLLFPNYGTILVEILDLRGLASDYCQRRLLSLSYLCAKLACESMSSQLFEEWNPWFACYDVNCQIQGRLWLAWEVPSCFWQWHRWGWRS